MQRAAMNEAERIDEHDQRKGQARDLH
jgi:hypothetical protein